MALHRLRITHKRGETFHYAGWVYHPNADGTLGAPVNLLTEVGAITSMVSAPGSAAPISLSVAKHSTETGRYDVTGNTSAWPLGLLEWDAGNHRALCI